MTLVSSKKCDPKNRYKNESHTTKTAVLRNSPSAPLQRSFLIRRRSIGINPLYSQDFGKPSNKFPAITVEDTQPPHHARVIRSTSEELLNGFVSYYAIGLRKSRQDTDSHSATATATKTANPKGNHAMHQPAQMTGVIPMRPQGIDFSTMGTFLGRPNFPMVFFGHVSLNVYGQRSNQLHGSL